MSPGKELLSHWEGEPLRVWEALWGVPSFEAWSAVNSTNDRLRELARKGARPFTVVTAEEQTAGRGRGGRAWHSPPGKGLWISVLLGPGASEPRTLTPLLVGLVVARAVEGEIEGDSPVGIKWPNDVMVRGRKVAGVLCESLGESGVVAGVGVNVRQREDDFPPRLRGRATSLESVSGAEVSRAGLAGRIVRGIRELLARPPDRVDGELMRELQARDVLNGREVEVQTGVSGRLEGVAAGIGVTGHLRLRTLEGEVRPVMAGTVRLARGGGA